MDTDLFMECEEEELEPWQLVDDDVEEDDMNIMECHDNAAQQTVLSAGCSSVGTIKTLLSTTTPSMTVSSRPNPSAPLVASAPMPAVASLVPTGIAQGQQLFLTQTSSGLGTILLPTGKPGTHSSINQPIFLTSQGFPVQNVRPAQNTINPMGFVLNMPNQPFQPITLLAGSPGAHVLRPVVGVPKVVPRAQPAQVRPQIQIHQFRAPTAPVQPRTTMAINIPTIKIPATLTIHTSQAGNASKVTFATSNTTDTLSTAATTTLHLNSQTQSVSKSSQQMKCPRCGSHFKMQAALQGHMCFCCPDIVNTTYASSTTVNTLGSPSRVVSANTSQAPVNTLSPSKLVMNVECFYYGTKKGYHEPDPNIYIRKTPMKCQVCSMTLIDNVSMMSHMWFHSNQGSQSSLSNALKSCQYCFRQFCSTKQWKCHLDKVHSPIEYPCICKICEWVFESEHVFLNHMKATHKPGEMPYICQVCEYSSSFFSHVYNHFLLYHRKTVYLLCVYCLKIFRNETSYQQHFLRHQNHKAFHCNKCRLQFIVLQDLIEHKTQHHRTVCKPKELEGLPSGTKVIIRARPANEIQVARRNPLMPVDPEFPPFPMQEPAHHYSALKLLKLKSPKKLPLSIESQQVKGNPHKRKSVSKMLDMLTKFQDKSGMLLDQRCMECGTGVASFPDHYPTSVRCLLCTYKTCCSRSYAEHMIDNHVPQTNVKSFPLHKKPPPCYFKLQCSGCDFSSPTGDLMAKHLVQNLDHKKSTCERKKYVEYDIGFCQDEELEKNEDLQKPAWALIEHWTKPLPPGVYGAITETLNFTGNSGPQHSLSKNSDAIDYFNLLFPKDLIELIAYETNAHVKTCQFLGWHDLNWIPVTTHDIKVFIGLSILMGLENLAELPHYWSWKHNAKCDTFFRAMTFIRFQQISSNICMGSLLTEEHSGNASSDKFHIFQPMHNILGPAMWNAYQPNQCLSIDRALLPSHEDKTSSTKGDSKAPPQVWLLCDSKSGYCHRFLIQLEKEKNIDLGFSVVSPLVEGLHEKHHQLFLASSLTSVPLMQKLLDQGIYSSSSFPTQSPIIPKEIWEQGRVEKPGDFLQRQYGPLLATRWMDTKEMGCLSTNAKPGEPDTVWRKSQTKVGELSPINRPLAFRLLQENMRGVDICKQLLACNPLGGLQHNKYWKSLFCFLVNLSIVNAFIVLRESRKDNPPLWVQDGLFTQVAFRKRLGNQLLKSVRKRTWVSAEFKVDTVQKKKRLRVQVKTEASTQQLDGDERKSVRHRMVRLTPRTRRCRTCHLKNLRHESVYGCIICKINLCKRTSCFWEYHGYPPNTQGNTKVGFVEDETRSNQWVTSDQEDDIDLGMAPVEEMDSDTDDDSQFEVIGEETSHQRESKPPLLLPMPAEPPDETQTELPVVKDNVDVLSARQLRIALFALCSGISLASADFSTQPQLIQKWLSDKRRQLMHDSKEQDRGKAAESLVEWVLSQRELQLPVNESNLFHKASEFHKQGSGSFRISYDWAVGFMLQHKLGLRPPGRAPTVSLSLPRSMENDISDFTKFTSRVIHVHKIPHTAIAAMDELYVFVDFKWLADETKVEKHAALCMVGSGDPLFTIYLAALADGTLLPTLVLTKEPLPDSVPSNHVILVAKQECMTREDDLDLWLSRVWQQHMPEKSHSNKAMLILDGHREHVSDHFLGTLSDCCTLPAVVPTGCTSRVQPVEMCIRPILQRFLIARWAQLATEDGLTGASCKDVVQLLTNWLVEALSCLADQPELVWKSFLITGLLTEQKNHETIQSLENTQSMLLTTLTGVLVGPELAAFEQEDEEDTHSEERDLVGKVDHVLPQPLVETDMDKIEVGEDMDEEDVEKTDDEDEDVIEDEDKMDED
ncbi:uncharacterized protein pogzb isoform X3 [Hypomesus transpacificus]|uniref:uncharacterized protein pogzb isoform X3 n=1 Tax=Hypomesus transpacificus TaxID=137520 RepID=UPI001F0730CC|nr:uncharacterized protein pogzb isoform X3 [Hypomesus transpacificus]